MKKAIALFAVAVALMPSASFAAAKHKPKAAATTYVCQKCHMKYSAAAAKKDHYIDPMDGGKLVPQTAAGKKSPSAKPMGGMKM